MEDHTGAHSDNDEKGVVEVLTPTVSLFCTHWQASKQLKKKAMNALGLRNRPKGRIIEGMIDSMTEVEHERMCGVLGVHHRNPRPDSDEIHWDHTFHVEEERLSLEEMIERHMHEPDPVAAIIANQDPAMRQWNEDPFVDTELGGHRCYGPSDMMNEGLAPDLIESVNQTNFMWGTHLLNKGIIESFQCKGQVIDTADADACTAFLEERIRNDPNNRPSN